MNMLFVEYPKCTTCKKAKKWLEVHKVEFEDRNMQLKDRLPDMSEEEQLKLLATDGMLVKRPLLICKDKVLVGFKEAEWEEKVR